MPRKGTWQRFRRAMCGGMLCFWCVCVCYGCVFCSRVVRFLAHACETCIYVEEGKNI